MTAWLLRRVAQAAVVVFLMTLIVFVGLHAIGNPVDILIGQDVDQVDRARIIAELGLDKPLWQQYLAFLNGALHGNLGNSFVYNIPAIELVIQRLPATLELAITALTFAVIGAIVGEFVGSSEGLGYLLHAYGFQLRIDKVFAVIVVLSVIGALLYFAIDWLEKRLIYWRSDTTLV